MQGYPAVVAVVPCVAFFEDVDKGRYSPCGWNCFALPDLVEVFRREVEIVSDGADQLYSPLRVDFGVVACLVISRLLGPPSLQSGLTCYNIDLNMHPQVFVAIQTIVSWSCCNPRDGLQAVDGMNEVA